MKKFIPAICTGLMLPALLCTGCNPSNGAKQGMSVMRDTYMFVMNTDAAIQVYDYFVKDGVNDEQLIAKYRALYNEIGQLLTELEGEMSATVQTSDIYRFNAAAAGERVEITANTFNVLSIAQDTYRLTEGYYNPAVYYSVQAYGFNGGGAFPKSAEEFPPESQIAEYIDLSNHFSDLALEQSEGKYYAVKPQYTVTVNDVQLSLKLDLGGVVKGYAADMVSALFDKYGFEYANFNFGSSSMAFKKYPNDAQSVKLVFSNPRRRYDQNGYLDPEGYLYCNVKDTCVSSSGDYENYFLLDADGDGREERYCHVFDPTTGRPVGTGVMSATVIGGSAAQNDCLTTALMAMGPERASAFITEKLFDRRVAFTYSVGEELKLFTNMQQGEYTLLDSRYHS